VPLTNQGEIVKKVQKIREDLDPGDPPLNPIHAFFGWFGGGALATLRKCSRSVQETRSARGALLFATVLASAGLAGLAWSLVSKSVAVGVVVAIAWFCVIGPLDRVLMASLDGVPSGKNRAKQFALVFARVGVVVVMAHLNANFVQLWMFNPEIEEVLRQDKQTRLDEANAKLREQQKAYRDWYVGERSRIDVALGKNRDARAALIDEISGKGGSGRPGYAQIAKAKEQALAQEEAALATEEKELAAAKQGGVEAKALAKAEQVAKEAEVAINSKEDGFSDRDEALKKVAGESSLVWWMYGLFLLVELLAFLAKMLGEKDEYDMRKARLNADAEAAFTTEDLEEDDRLRDLVKTDMEGEEELLATRAGLAKKSATHRKEIMTALGDELDGMKAHAVKVKATVQGLKEGGLTDAARDIERQEGANVINLRKRQV